MFRALAVSLSVSATAILCQPVFAADMIEGYRPPPATRHVVYHPKKVYVRKTFHECDQLLVEYRPPYRPHTEIVTICHPRKYVLTRY
ncbi:hypothetical protein G9X68_08330 [Rhizobium sp. WYCCWR 11279]|nr:hypothetical protein [Rhizobium changzhiense]